MEGTFRFHLFTVNERNRSNVLQLRRAREQNCVAYICDRSHVRREWNGCPIFPGDSGAAAFNAMNSTSSFLQVLSNALNFIGGHLRVSILSFLEHTSLLSLTIIIIYRFINFRIFVMFHIIFFYSILRHLLYNILRKNRVGVNYYHRFAAIARNT